MSAENETGDEGFVGRWSRRKAETSQTADETPPDPPDAELPPTESLTPDSDYSGFLSLKVSAALRRQALRRLFHSGAIAGPDGLDDYDEDFRSFEPLGDVMTADRRHRRDTEKETTATSDAATETETMVAKDATAPAPAPKTVERKDISVVEYVSRGRLLIIAPFRNAGDETRALELGTGLRDRLNCCLVLSRVAMDTSGEFVEHAKAAGISLLAGPEVSLAGYMGQFIAVLRDRDTAIDVAAAAGEFGTFDLILDLSDPPLLRAELPPPGYFAPANDPAALETALQELPGLIGTFEKPNYVRYDPNRCAHSRSGIQGCRRCLGSCPAEAIRTVGDRIEVDPFLCQGGGSCVSACPTGALRYNYPSGETLMATVRGALKSYYAAGGAHPVLLFHDGNLAKEILSATEDAFDDRLVRVAVEEIGVVGFEICAAALAYGSAAIAVLATSAAPASVRAEIESQISILHALLDGLDLGPGRVQFVGVDPARSLLRRLEPLSKWSALEPATHLVFDDKRTDVWLAIDHLYAQTTSAVTVLRLPSSAPFGSVTVAPDACTLCMACPSLCPTGALQAGNETPQLSFVEDKCVQCGLCRHGCPEAAIEITARLMLEPEARRRPRILAEDEPFHCVLCGTPFGTVRTIERISAKLSGHPMFEDAAARHRLKMCEDCRVVDLFAAGDDIDQ